MVMGLKEISSNLFTLRPRDEDVAQLLQIIYELIIRKIVRDSHFRLWSLLHALKPTLSQKSTKQLSSNLNLQTRSSCDGTVYQHNYSV